MRKPFLLVLLFIIQNAAFSQDCDSLNKEFEKLFEAGYFDSARNVSNSAIIACLPSKPDLNSYAKTLINHTNMLNHFGDFKSSLENIKKIFTYEEVEDKIELNNYVMAVHLLSNLRINLGDYTTAKNDIEDLLNILKSKKVTDSTYFSLLYNDIGLSYFNSTEYSKSVEYYFDAFNYLTNSHEDSLSYNVILGNIAFAYQNSGEYNNALNLYRKITDRYKITKQDNSLDYATLLNNYSALKSDLGLISEALGLQKEAYKIKYGILPGNHPDIAYILKNIGSTYRKMGAYDSAILYNKMALEIIRISRGIANRDFSITANNVALTYSEMNLFDSAKVYFDTTLQILKTLYGVNNTEYGAALINYGGLFSRQQNWSQAIPNLLQGLKIRLENLNENFLRNSSTYKHIARCYLYLNLPDSADFYYTKLLNLYYFNNTNTLPFMSEIQRRTFIKSESEIYDSYNSFAFVSSNSSKRYKASYSNSLFLKSLSLNETKKSLQAIRNSTDTAVQNIFQNLSGIKNYLSKQYTLPIFKQAPNIKEKETEAQDIEQQLAIKSAEFRRYEQSINVTASDVYKTLKPGEAAIEFTSFKYYSRNGWTDSTLYAAIILTAKDSVPKWVYLFEEKQLKKLLFTTHPNLLYSNAKILASQQQQYGDKLYNLIWKKIEPQMAGINTVYYSPSGILNQAALAAIPFNASSKTISSKYNLVQMGSTKNIVVHEPEIPVTNIALIGGIRYNADSVSFAANTTDSGFGNANIYTTTIMRGSDKATKTFDYLPATLTEVNSITATAAAAGIATIAYTENNATEETLKKMDGHSPSVLHIATHGFYLPYKNKKATDDFNQTNFSLIEDPMLRSGIALAGANLKWNKNIDVPNREDGIVTAYEIAQMDLSKTELVVLSACESGLGDIDGSEGVFGLQRGFKSAGVNKLILTLWQVPDKASMEFMTLFYQKWLKEKKDIRTSFADTQKTMSEKYKAEPYKWAGFVLIE